MSENQIFLSTWQVSVDSSLIVSTETVRTQHRSNPAMHGNPKKEEKRRRAKKKKNKEKLGKRES